MAGSGIRGQFEEKFKNLIRDIEEEAGNVICFIDELRELNYGACAIDHLHLLRHALQSWKN